MMPDDPVAHLTARHDRVDVASPGAAPLDVPLLDEVPDDPLGGAFRDPDALGDVPEPNLGIAGDREQDGRVVRHERPGGSVFDFGTRHSRYDCRTFSVVCSIVRGGWSWLQLGRLSWRNDRRLSAECA